VIVPFHHRKELVSRAQATNLLHPLHPASNRHTVNGDGIALILPDRKECCMNRFLIAALLVAAVPGSNALAAAFPWFHTRPKPVILDEPAPPPPAAAPSRVAWHGSAIYSKSGRLYFDDAWDRRSQTEPSAKFHIADVFPIYLLTGSQPAKPHSK
jgi:hypothetical protein